MKKILSIVIPTYNAEKFLDRGLPTFIVEDEKFRNAIEVIVVNDGTPDKSVEVAQKYVDQYPEIFQIVNKENGGHGSAINVGVTHASGAYLKVVDADDWVNTEALLSVMKTLDKLESEQENAADALLLSYCTYDLEKEAKGENPYEDKLVVPGEKTHAEIPNLAGPYTDKEIVGRWNDAYWGLTFHGVIYNTSFYKSLGKELVEGVFYEDQQYVSVPMAYAKRVFILDEKLYEYRIGDVNQSISLKSCLNRLDHYETVIRTLIKAGEDSSNFSDGGEELWATKTSKFVNDYYQLCLVKNPDKKMLRRRMKEFTQEIKRLSPVIYCRVKKTYKVFSILNRIHMSEETYQNKFMPMLHKARK